VTETVGKRLRRLRLERDLSQRELAAPGVSYAYISRIEAGTRQPSVKALRKLAGRLGVSAAYLETGVERTETDDLAESLVRSTGQGISSIVFRLDPDAEVALTFGYRDESRIVAGATLTDALARAVAWTSEIDRIRAEMDRLADQLAGEEASATTPNPDGPDYPKEMPVCALFPDLVTMLRNRRVTQRDDGSFAEDSFDFGVWWRDRRGGVFRLTWIGPRMRDEPSLAGELYLVRLDRGDTRDVELLCVIPPVDGDAPDENVERILDGWGDVCGAEGSVLWVRDRAREAIDAGWATDPRRTSLGLLPGGAR
jgi:transcriptional regulator with XRE-family HTH domain